MIDQLQQAERQRSQARRWRKAASVAQARGNSGSAAEIGACADCSDLAADELMSGVTPPTIVAGEVVPTEGERPDHRGGWAIRNTLASPDTASIAASLERTDLLSRPYVDVLALGMDAAASAGGNSLEKMLAHQLALAHKTAFHLTDRAMGERDTVEMARLINSAARMMNVYQQGLLALHRVRTGGMQTVTVQHIAVNGGQAVVTGAMQAGGQAATRTGGGA